MCVCVYVCVCVCALTEWERSQASGQGECLETAPGSAQWLPSGRPQSCSLRQREKDRAAVTNSRQRQRHKTVAATDEDRKRERERQRQWWREVEQQSLTVAEWLLHTTYTCTWVHMYMALSETVKCREVYAV